MQAHEERGHHQIGDREKSQRDLLTRIHVGVKTDGERQWPGHVANDFNGHDQRREYPDRTDEVRKILPYPDGVMVGDSKPGMMPIRLQSRMNRKSVPKNGINFAPPWPTASSDSPWMKL